MSSLTESIEVQNVVASSSIDRELDLAALASDMDGTEFTPDRFPGLVYHIQDPKAAGLIFRSGNIVCTGAESIESVAGALEQVVENIRALGVSVPRNPEMEVQNIVSSADLGRRLNLTAVAIGLGLEHVEYEPEQFPGLIYRLDDPNVVSLLFGSGKLVITGTKETGAAHQAIKSIDRELQELGIDA